MPRKIVVNDIPTSFSLWLKETIFQNAFSIEFAYKYKIILHKKDNTIHCFLFFSQPASCCYTFRYYQDIFRFRLTLYSVSNTIEHFIWYAETARESQDWRVLRGV